MRRSKRGSGIVEGACGLCLVIISSVAGTLLILNSGTSLMFKTKLMLITAQAAQFAAAHHSDGDFQGETQSFVQQLMPSLGMTPSRLTVTVARATMGGAEGMQVTVSNQFPLFGNGLLPDHVQFADTEWASHTFSGDANS